MKQRMYYEILKKLLRSQMMSDIAGWLATYCAPSKLSSLSLPVMLRRHLTV